jgi:CubicO group peptidase (beta-lactamase class C family)
MGLPNDLGDLVPAVLERHRVPGLSIAHVARDGHLQVAGFGVRQVGKAGRVNGNTVFAAASLTKPVFALGTLRLWASEGLDLDAPLVRYLPRLVVPKDRRSRAITARMVLSHTTGLPNWRRPNPLAFRFDPGARWGYSGEGYMHLQAVVEHVTGSSLEDYMRKAVFRPLGMASTSYVWDDSFARRFATGYNTSDEPEPLWSPDAAMAAGSLLTTVSDYARFLRHVLTSWDDPVIQLMLTRTVAIDDTLGWAVGIGSEQTASGPAWWQWGNDPGYKTFVLLTESQAVVVFTNGDRGARAYPQVIRSVLKRRHPCLALARRPVWTEFWKHWATPSVRP